MNNKPENVLKRPSIRVSKETLEEDKQFVLEKKNRDLITSDLCLALLPIVRQYNFLSKAVLRDCLNQTMYHIISPKGEN